MRLTKAGFKRWLQSLPPDQLLDPSGNSCPIKCYLSESSPSPEPDYVCSSMYQTGGKVYEMRKWGTEFVRWADARPDLTWTRITAQEALDAIGE